MSDEKPLQDKGASAPATTTPPRRTSVFAIVTLIAAVIAMSILVWRIGRAWRIEYGGEPRPQRPVPTSGSFGPPGGVTASTPSATPSSP